MSKRLLTNNYSSALLDSWDDFITFGFEINQYSNKPQLLFKWRFKSFNGSGYIDYDETFNLRNTFGDNFSYLSLSMESRDKHADLKSTDSLYDDSGLGVVFQRILDDYFKN